MIQTEARGETGAMMEGMVGEEGILPERSEWFRSMAFISREKRRAEREGKRGGGFLLRMKRGKRRMNEECIQMVVDYYQSKDTPYLLMLYAMSDHSDEAYEALRRLLTERHIAIPPQSSRMRSSAPRRQPVALVRARILLLIAALASLDWRTAVVALVAAMASWVRAGRFQQGAMIGTVICMVMTGVFVFNGMVVARHDTSSWLAGMIVVLLRHGGLSFVLAGWAFVSLRHKEGV